MDIRTAHPHLENLCGLMLGFNGCYDHINDTVQTRWSEGCLQWSTYKPKGGKGRHPRRIMEEILLSFKNAFKPGGGGGSGGGRL